MLELILGGARSGKSRYAETRARESGLEVVYIATATAGDEEMAARIDHHRNRRPGDWTTVEEPVALARTLAERAALGRCIIVDCLTLWLCNILFDSDGGPAWARFRHEREDLVERLPQLPGRILLVSNEIGLGVVPPERLTRTFVDEAGRLHQDLAQLCDRVVLMTAGLPQVLK